MNGFLVLLTCGQDDWPVGLFESHDTAVTFAQQHERQPPVGVEKLFRFNASEACCMKVVEFRLGVPSVVEIIKDFAP